MSLVSPFDREPPTPAQRAALLEEARRAPLGSGLRAIGNMFAGYTPARAAEPSSAQRRAAAEADEDHPSTAFVPNPLPSAMRAYLERLEHPAPVAKNPAADWSDALASVNAKLGSPIRDDLF